MAGSIEQQIAVLTKKLQSIKAIEVPRATASALNKTAAAAKTRTVRGVAKSIVVPQKHVRKRVYISRANSKKMRVRLRNYYRGISVIDLNARDSGKSGWRSRKGRGVKAGKRTYSSAFIARGRNGKQHVFERKGSARLPVDVVRVDIRKQVEDIAPKAAARELKSNYAKRLKSDLAWRLSKYEA
jgi:hypothetical protein